MAAIESVTTPLVIRFADHSEKVVAHCFPHQHGLLYLDLFWHLGTPDQHAHLILGELSGDGPWKIGDCVIRLLGCANTDPHLQEQSLPWSDYLARENDAYPGKEQIIEIAKRLGANIA